MNIKKERIDSLQIVRALAFMGVFLYHSIRSFPGEGYFYVFTKSLGRWGVSVFFVLSGFLMTYSYWNRPPKTHLKDSFLFSIKKIKKLYPLHLLMLFFGVIYLVLQGEPLPRILLRLFIAVPLLQTWFPVGYQAINSVAWYLSVCVFLYFCFPHLLNLIKRSERKVPPIGIILIIFLLQLSIGYFVFHYTNIDIKWITYCHPVFRLGDFAIGGFVTPIYLNRKPSTLPKHLSQLFYSVLEILSFVLNVLVCIFYAGASEESSWFTYTSLFIPTTVLLIYAFSLGRGIISKLLTNRFIFWLAAISPYAFLVHRLLIHYYHDFITYILHYDHVNFMIVFLVPFGITVLSIYLYLAFDKMTRDFIYRHIKNKKS